MQRLTCVPDHHPLRTLVAVCVGWKIILLLVACCSPGPGYDTSASLLASGHREGLPSGLRYLTGKLVRWDAIYFVTVSHRGYLFEQEWAFGWGFSRLVALMSRGLENAGLRRYEGIEALAAIAIAHLSHLLSVPVVFHLTRAIFPSAPPRFSFVAAALHVVSPAGLFLSAPYAESSCALLTFFGCFIFTKTFSGNGRSTFRHDFLLIVAGVVFGVATAFRSNAILNGLLLLEEAFRTLWDLKQDLSLTTFRRLITTGIGGLSVAAGFLLPQYIAYEEYCGHHVSTRRPWCEQSPPSIYGFVQDHYWNVGLFDYWTLSNLPLFLLAAPMLAILMVSSMRALELFTKEIDALLKRSGGTKATTMETSNSGRQILRNLAVSQLILAVLTLTTAHVQIITRLASAYPVWLWFTSMALGDERGFIGGTIVKFSVIYGMIQGGLFASFLPPA